MSRDKQILEKVEQDIGKQFERLEFKEFTQKSDINSCSVDENENIIALNLNSLNLSDYSFLTELKNLVCLYLNNNQLADISFLKDLKSLVILDLRNNQITDISSLKDLKSLTALNLTFNNIRDYSVLKDLKSLKILQLWNNKLTYTDIQFLKDLTALTTLEINNNDISDFSVLKDLTELTTLDLKNNNISDKDITFLRNLKKLTTLNLKSNHLTLLPPEITELEYLKTLDLSGNQLTLLPSEIKNLKNLVELILSENQLTSLPSEIGDLTNLNKLDLKGNRLTTLPREIIKLNESIELVLDRNPLKSPPRQLIKKGNKKIFDYLREQLGNGEELEVTNTTQQEDKDRTTDLQGVNSETTTQTLRMGSASPTPKIVSDHWVKDDALGYEAYARAIASPITHNDTVPPLTIGIKAPWGTGKTSLMKMVQYILDGDAEITEKNEAAKRNLEIGKITFSKLLDNLEDTSKICWDEIKESDDKELKEFLKKKYVIGWIENAKIKKKSDAEIKISTKSNYLSLKLNDKKTEVSVEIDNVRTDKLLVKTENGKLNIYSITKPMELKPSKKGNSYDIPPRMTVWFNAWKYQTSEQIWAGLAHCIISQVTARMNPIEREVFWLKLNAKRLDTDKIRRQVHKMFFEKYLLRGLLFGCGILLFLIIIFSFLGFSGLIPQLGTLGITASSIWLDARKKWEDKLSEKVSGVLTDIVREPNYEGKMGFLYLVESDIREVLNLVATPERPLVIFVDDLDRCSPCKVAEVVEAINLFLSGDYPNCIFVIGMDPGIVAAALEVENKDLIEKINDFSVQRDQTPLGWRFMEKIIQLPLAIPPVDDPGMKKYINFLIGTIETVNSAVSAPQEKIPEEKNVKRHRDKFSNAGSVAEISQIKDELFNQFKDSQNRADIVEAYKRAYSQELKDRDPIIRNFIESSVNLFNANPRQIKRYINLFRFSSTLREYISVDYEAHTGKRPEMPSDEVLIKFVTLHVQWPQAIDCLMKVQEIEIEGSSKVSKVAPLFGSLEKEAKSLSKENDAQGDKKWKLFLEENGFKFGDWAHSRQFRQFLASGESLANFRGNGLW